jgi:hypothetical protein
MESKGTETKRDAKSIVFIEIKDLRRFSVKGKTLFVYDEDKLVMQYDFQLEIQARDRFSRIMNAIEFGAKSVTITWEPDLPEGIVEEFGMK